VLPYTLVACGGASRVVLSTDDQWETVQTVQDVTTVTASATDAGSKNTPEQAESAWAAEDSEDHSAAQAEAMAASASAALRLNGDSITVAGDGATVDGSRVTITLTGTYTMSGSLVDGQVVVDTQEEGVVGLSMCGVGFGRSSGAAIEFANAQEAVLVLSDCTENRLSDAATRADETEDSSRAALFSMANLTISGSGVLTAEGNYRDGITGKDGLFIAGGTIAIESADDGIRGKDYLIAQGGSITVDSQGDGLVSDNEADATQGYIVVEDGQIDVTAGGDDL
jgi:hypothetical protein